MLDLFRLPVLHFITFRAGTRSEFEKNSYEIKARWRIKADAVLLNHSTLFIPENNPHLCLPFFIMISFNPIFVRVLLQAELLKIQPFLVKVSNDDNKFLHLMIYHLFVLTSLKIFFMLIHRLMFHLYLSILSKKMSLRI